MFSHPQLSSNRLKQIRKLKLKKYRNETGYFLCEGYRLFEAALDGPDVEISEIIIDDNFRKSTQGDAVIRNGTDRGIAIFSISESGMKSISEDISPPGILFIVKKSSGSLIPIKDIEENSIIYLEKISDPGNLGTIIRSASWFGVKTILLSPDCVDPWNSKSVRASAGAIFRTNIYTDTKYNLLKEQLRNKNYKFIATVVSEGTPLNRWKIDHRNVLFFGQEASGLSKEIIKDADLHINITGSGYVESLNLSVAASIVLYEITRVGEKSSKLER